MIDPKLRLSIKDQDARFWPDKIVVWFWPDQPDRFRRPCCWQAGASQLHGIAIIIQGCTTLGLSIMTQTSHSETLDPSRSGDIAEDLYSMWVWMCIARCHSLWGLYRLHATVGSSVVDVHVVLVILGDVLS